VSLVADEILWELSGLHRRLREVASATPALDRKPTEEANSIAVLVTHAIGAELAWLHLAAGRSHTRDRATEFAVSAATAQELIRAVDEAERIAPDLVRAAFSDGLETQRDRPDARPVSAGYCLTHAVAHTAEHVGQAELTRQLLAPTSATAR
jgi:uncharacterized damage-inducible protein DinB